MQWSNSCCQISVEKTKLNTRLCLGTPYLDGEIDTLVVFQLCLGSSGPGKERIASDAIGVPF